MNSEILRMLCTDPEGNVSMQGSEEDRRLMRIAIRYVENLEQKLRIAENVLDMISQSGTHAGILAQDAIKDIEQVGK